jgi:hypothetical protein
MDSCTFNGEHVRSCIELYPVNAYVYFYYPNGTKFRWPSLQLTSWLHALLTYTRIDFASIDDIDDGVEGAPKRILYDTISLWHMSVDRKSHVVINRTYAAAIRYAVFEAYIAYSPLKTF